LIRHFCAPVGLISHRVFDRLNYPVATRLAKSLGKSLPVQRDYSLAEVFAENDTENAPRPASVSPLKPGQAVPPPSPKIGLAERAQKGTIAPVFDGKQPIKTLHIMHES